MPGKAPLVKAFVDTNILLYALAPSDFRSAVSEKILGEGPVLSVQVLNECVNVMRRKLLWNWVRIEEVLAIVQDLCGPPLTLTYEIHQGAVEIAKRYNFRIYDSLILSAALDAGCSTLYSEDMQNGQKIGTLMIRNPFSQS